MNKKEVTFTVKYEIVLYTPVSNARWGGVFPVYYNITLGGGGGGRGGGQPNLLQYYNLRGGVCRIYYNITWGWGAPTPMDI